MKTRNIAGSTILSPLKKVECEGLRDSVARGLYDNLFTYTRLPIYKK